MCSVLIGLPVNGFYAENAFLEVGIVLILTIFVSSAIGLLISSALKAISQAILIVPAILIFKFLFSGMMGNLTGIIEKISYFTVTRWSAGMLGAIADLNHLLPAERQHWTEAMYERSVLNFLGSGGVLLLFAAICTITIIYILRTVSKDTRITPH
jgi:hypothetical protein